MSFSEPPPMPAPDGVREFRTTHWSVVLSAGRRDSVSAERALTELCRVSWYPLYAYVRRSGRSAEDAQDLTQEFFSRLLEKNWLAEADPTRGRFRTFLLATLKHFLANEWNRAHCLKHGGGCEIIAWDAVTAEERYALEPPDVATPELLYDRRWALTLLARAQDRLRDEMTTSGQRQRFEVLEPTLTGERTALPYQKLATHLGVTETAVKSMVLRLRRRFRVLLREEITQTIGDTKEVDSELASLFAALKS